MSHTKHYITSWRFIRMFAFLQGMTPILELYNRNWWQDNIKEQRKQLNNRESQETHLTTNANNLSFFMLPFNTFKKRFECKTSTTKKFLQMQINCLLSFTINIINCMLRIWLIFCNLTAYNHLKKWKRITSFDSPAEIMVSVILIPRKRK